jgi:hypothetical protein
LASVAEASLGKGEPDHRAADHHVVNTNGRNLAGEEIFFATELAEKVDVSSPLVAEGPALADADAGKGIRGGAELFDEILGLQGGEVLVECHHQRVGDAHALHEPKFKRCRREQPRHGVRTKDSCRVRIEGESDGGGSDFFRLAQGLAENRLMPEVHSVKNPSGYHHRALDFRQPFDGSEDSHHAPRKRETAGRLRTR